jgi:predicted SnoaL-like aldol condensation-catalyzing enzyme
MNCLFLEDLVGMRNHVTQKLEKSEELLTNYFRKLDSQLVDHFDKAINQFPKLEDSSKFDP